MYVHMVIDQTHCTYKILFICTHFQIIKQNCEFIFPFCINSPEHILIMKYLFCNKCKVVHFYECAIQLIWGIDGYAKNEILYIVQCVLYVHKFYLLNATSIGIM